MLNPTVITIEPQPNYVMVRIKTERLDDNNIEIVRANATAAAEESPNLPVVLDMAEVHFLPSFSLSGLVKLTREFRANGQRLILTGLQPFVRETITITRLDQVFEIMDDLSAIKASS